MKDWLRLLFRVEFLSIVLALSALIGIVYWKTKGSPWSKHPKENLDQLTGLDSLVLPVEVERDLRQTVELFKKTCEGNAEVVRKGVLLYGASGTGKTSIARALAKECSAKLLIVNACEVIEVNVGQGSARIREVFDKARQIAPCVVFIDEIDALGKRSQSSIGGVNYEINSTINQLLVELDGFEATDKILVIAATNRIQMVDPSLIRSGRFDLKIKLQLPNQYERFKILEKKIKSEKHPEITQEYLVGLSEKLEKYSGADLEALVNEAVYSRLQHGREGLMIDDFDYAYKKLNPGLIEDQDNIPKKPVRNN